MTEIDEKAAVKYATWLDKYNSGGIKWNLARAALRWRDELDALKADQTDWRNGVGSIAAALGKSTLSCVDLAEAALEVRANLEQAQARIAELEAQAIPERLKVMCKCGDEIGPESLVSLCAPCADALEAERAAAIKRAEEAEGKLRAMESRMERIRLALLASMSDEQLAEARHE